MKDRDLVPMKRDPSPGWSHELRPLSDLPLDALRQQVVREAAEAAKLMEPSDG